MELTWGTLVFLIVAAVGLWFWRDSLLVRDLANTAAMDACERMGLQFLDGTVAFSKLRLVRDSGVIRLRRVYIFDYTAHSIDRMQGFVVLIGTHLETVGFARSTEHMQRAVPEPAPLRVTYSFNAMPQRQQHTESGGEIGSENSVKSTNSAQPAGPQELESEATSEPSVEPASNRPKAKVLNLDDWRASRTRH